MAATKSLQARVDETLAALLEAKKAVDPIGLFVGIGWLPDSCVKAWERGLFNNLEASIASTPEKRRKVLQRLESWALEQGLQPFTASYLPASTRMSGELQVSTTGDAELEALYRRHFMRGDISEKQQQKVKEKAQKAPDIIVVVVSKLAVCAECTTALHKGTFMILDQGQPLCLDCADLGHLIFLPSGDATLTRRASKESRLRALVMKWNRSIKRYQRLGILIEEQALEAAENSCMADADARRVQRERAAIQRQDEDANLLADLTMRINELFPSCPPETAHAIAAHTSRRGSGCVGRSAAGRELETRAVELAVIAHIRHTETDYDFYLMKGISRENARHSIRNEIDEVLRRWRRH